MSRMKYRRGEGATPGKVLWVCRVALLVQPPADAFPQDLFHIAILTLQRSAALQYTGYKLVELLPLRH
jgi:hypothetical protein